jgi:Acyclic terpene utilisation family protein AtuA
MLASGTKVITNAGALNPRGCAAAMQKEAEALGFKPRIAFVEGDDLRDRAEEFRRQGFRDMFSGAAFPDKPVTSVNAYIGSFPIAAALAKGADIVVTGRVVGSRADIRPADPRILLVLR